MVFDFVQTPRRTQKPRMQGITMVLDKGLGRNAVRDLMVVREWIDTVKLGWGSPVIFSESFLKRKIRWYERNGIEVSSGGTLLELAYAKNKIDEFFEEARRLGLAVIEVSNGKIDLSIEEKAGLIEKAISCGFGVCSEIGKKDPKEDEKLSLGRRVKEAKSDLKAGAKKVILEARESGRVGIYDRSGNVRESFVKKLVEGIGLENIIFEAPMKNQQTWLILNFGSEVNLGNIKPVDVVSLETLRRGIRGDTFGKIC
jgi:phosphosulfolactate synthase